MQAESLTNQGDFDTDLFVCCSFRHGLRRATSLREEGFGFPRKPNLSLPLGEMSRSDREGWNPLYSFSGLPDTNLPAFCPLSHLLCKCQLSQRESREAGANRTPDEPSGRLCRLARVLLLPSRLAQPSSERKAFALTHRPNLSLPLGEMSRSDREG